MQLKSHFTRCVFKVTAVVNRNTPKKTAGNKSHAPFLAHLHALKNLQPLQEIMPHATIKLHPLPYGFSITGNNNREAEEEVQ